MDVGTEFDGLSFKVKNFMCFGDEPQGFDQILPINIIVGRNNAGKTALVEMLYYLSDPLGLNVSVPAERFRGNSQPEFILTAKLSPVDLERAYPKNRGLNGNPNDTPFKRAQPAIGHYASLVFGPTLQSPRIDLPQILQGVPGESFASLVRTPLRSKRLIRLSSERDIVPEHSNVNLYLDKNGAGATRVLHELRNAAKYARLPEAHEFLDEINKIMGPDLRFSALDVKRDEHDTWEIFLTEEGKHPIALSNLGSGLKTVILVLLNLHIAKYITHTEPKTTISGHFYVFEEIENFLHPAVQRRLLLYLRDFALANGCVMFISSHSNISIDMFSTESYAQIVHVTSDGKPSRVERATTYLQHKGILDDLDVRASDLLQSNGVVWVEGPSDRIYLNRWIELMTDGKLKEGAHYQIVFYGGRLLSHLSCADPDESKKLVSILRVNRNAAIVIDSDKQSDGDPVNETKRRLVAEVESLNGVAWVSKGKEIENYIPESVIKKMYPSSTPGTCDQYSNFFDYLDTVQGEQGRYFSGRKPMLAEKAAEVFSVDDLPIALDLTDRLNELCDAIRKWNRVLAE